MLEIVGTNIYAGKKNALIVLDNVHGNVVTNTTQQVLAKLPCIHFWEGDPSGIQIGIASRALSPNRSWEFNVRQNGYDIAADPFGYPEETIILSCRLFNELKSFGDRALYNMGHSLEGW